MFDLEFLNLVKKYKESSDMEKKIVERNIINFLNMNEQNLENFLHSETYFSLSDDYKILVEHIIKNFEDYKKREIIKNNDEEKKTELVDNVSERNALKLRLLKENFSKWLSMKQRDENCVSEDCKKFFYDFFTNYLRKDIVLFNILKNVKLENSFNEYRTTLLNYLRLYLIEELKNRFSESSPKKNLIKRIFYYKKILKIYDELEDYNFNFEEINELEEKMLN